MQKAYNRTYWENLPSEKTEIDADNLNNIETGIDELDNRILTIDLTKLNKTSASGMMTGFALDTDTGVITITFFDGSKYSINTNLGKIALNITYDHENERLVLTMPDGSVTYVDMSALITQYEFIESDEIWFEVTSEGKVKASIKNGSISEAKLRPNFLADIKTESAKASTSAQSASSSANAAATSEANAKKSADSAAESEEKAKMYAENASAVTGIQIATKDIAGIIKGGENHIAEDGELILTKRTDSPTLYNSHAGGIKVNGLGGASEQETTSGAQLFDGNEPTVLHETTCKCEDNQLTLATKVTGTSTTYTYAYWDFDADTLRTKGITDLTLSVSKMTAQGSAIPLVRLAQRANESEISRIELSNAGEITLEISDEAEVIRCIIYSNCGGTCAVGDGIIYTDLMLNAGSTALPWEKFTGGQPSPNPEYPQAIKPVTGKNELDCRGLVEQTINGVTFTPVKDEYDNILYVEANGTATIKTDFNLTSYVYLPNDEYILSGCPSGGSATTYNLAIYTSSNDSWVNVFDSGFDFTVNAKEYIRVIATVRAGYTADHLRFYPMIRKASIADPTYVPYGCLRIWGHGANQFDKDNAKYVLNVNVDADNGVFKTTSGNVRLYYMDAEPNTTYIFSKTLGSFNRVCTCSQIPSSGGSITNMNTNTSNNEVTIMTGANDRYIAFYPLLLSEISTIGYTAVINTVLIAPTQSITLSQPIELNGINGGADELVSGTKRFATVVFDGSDDENWTVGGTNTNGLYRLSISVENTKKNVDNNTIPNILSSHFGAITPSNTFGNKDGISVSTSGILILYNNKFNTSDVSLWKAHLAENPMEVTYELAEPVIEPLPTADQIALHSLMSYDGVTYLYCDSEVQPTWDLEYGTSKVGAYLFEYGNTTKRNEILYHELVSTVLALNQE